MRFVGCFFIFYTNKDGAETMTDEFYNLKAG